MDDKIKKNPIKKTVDTDPVIEVKVDKKRDPHNTLKVFVSMAFGIIVLSCIFFWNSIDRLYVDWTTSNSPSAAYDAPAGISAGPMVSFNFDDGFASVYEAGLPIIESAGFKTSQYIIINRIGAASYMSLNQILRLQKNGHEIGAHTRSHSILTEMSSEDALAEVEGSKKDLLAKGVREVSTFSYPEGDFNQSVRNVVEKAGFKGARVTNPGLNDASVDPFKLLFMGMNSEATFPDVKAQIDAAILQKKWLILVFHRVGESGYENVSAELLQQIVDYIQEKHVPVVTTAQGLYVLENIQP